MKNSKFIKTLEQYKENGLLYSQVHPTLPLTIWNYTPKTQYEALWDDITLMCRGLVTDDKGKIVARPFKKFFNIEENRHIPTDDFEVFEKLDGSLIIIFLYMGKMVIASRGSFTSDHVQWANEIIDEKWISFKALLRNGITYCFELIHPENRIVVDYGEFKNIILTGWIDTETGEEYEDFGWRGVPKVKKYEGLDWQNIKQLNWKNSEGFVVRFSNGDRCKIKFEDYVRLHRVMTNISDRKIWKALSEGQPITSILENVPDEFFQEVHRVEEQLKQEYQKIESMCRLNYVATVDTCNERAYGRKEFARLIQNFVYKDILFAMLDGKDYSQMIWKLLKP